MSRLFAVIVRLIAICLGFFIACMTAAISYLFLSGLVRPSDFVTYSELEMTITLLISVGTLTMHFANLSLFPFLMAATLLEIKSIRNWLVYALGAVLIALISGAPGFNLDPDLSKAGPFVASAMFGGVIYWFLVGRRAGRWK